MCKSYSDQKVQKLMYVKANYINHLEVMDCVHIMNYASFSFLIKIVVLYY